MVQVRIDLWDVALDADRLDELTSGLRLELLDAGLPSEPAADDVPPPAGARAVDAVTVGAIVVTLASGVNVLRETLALVRDWRARHRQTGIRLRIGDREIELTSATEATEERLLAAFLADEQRD